jgi:hypothetical protein
LIDAGNHFFGSGVFWQGPSVGFDAGADGAQTMIVSHGLAMVVEKAVSQWGLPNGYILGEEVGGAFVGGLRYGNGTL